MIILTETIPRPIERDVAAIHMLDGIPRRLDSTWNIHSCTNWGASSSLVDSFKFPDLQRNDSEGFVLGCFLGAYRKKGAWVALPSLPTQAMLAGNKRYPRLGKTFKSSNESTLD